MIRKEEYAEKAVGCTPEVFYLGSNPELYFQNLDIYRIDSEVDETPVGRLKKLLQEEKNVKARELMFENLTELKKRLTEYDKVGDFSQDYDVFLLKTVRDIAEEALSKITDENAKKISETFLKKLTEPGFLFGHLRESGESINDFFKNVPDQDLLTDHQKKLLEFAGKTHDMAKLLGGLNAQIDPDHEFIYQELMTKHLVGKKYQDIYFTAEDVVFITSVVGFHEDIYREKYFATMADTLRKDTEVKDPQKTVERARTIFHFIDIFGNAVRFDNGILKITDQVAFRSRFIDLYQRHIHLPLKSIDPNGTNWSIGKVFRPQWGEHGVAGLTHTFKLLQEWGVNVDPELITSVQDGIIEVLTKAEDALTNIEDYVLTVEITNSNQKTIDEELIEKMKQIRETKSRIQKEINVQ